MRAPDRTREPTLSAVHRVVAVAVVLSVLTLSTSPADPAPALDAAAQLTRTVAVGLHPAPRVAPYLSRSFSRAVPRPGRAVMTRTLMTGTLVTGTLVIHNAAPAAPSKVAPAVREPVVAGAAAIVIAFALAQVGKPYVWGAAGPSSFDCSGLVLAAFARVGIRLPHDADAIGGMGRPVPPAQWQPGVVISYGGHVALYIGGNRMVEAAHAGVPIRVTTMRPGNGRWLF